MIGVEHVIGLSALLFMVGAVGAILGRGLIKVLLSIELMLGAASLVLVGFDRGLGASVADGPGPGLVFALLIIVCGAAQLVVGLAILIGLLRTRDSLDVDDASTLKW